MDRDERARKTVPAPPEIPTRGSINLVERLHGTEKERTKVMRGFDTEDGAAMIAEDFRVHYNFVKPHMALDGPPPGDAAGVSLPDGFRWRRSSTPPSPEKSQRPARAKVKSNHPIRGQNPALRILI